MLLYQLVTILFIFVSTILHFTIVSAEDCPKISHPGEEVGRISDPRIKEGSGLVASHTYPDIFWTLNDHNGLNHVFAVSTKLNGTVVTRVANNSELKCAHILAKRRTKMRTSKFFKKAHKCAHILAIRCTKMRTSKILAKSAQFYFMS